MHLTTPPAGTPTVSVILPTHNRATLLPRSIDSVLAQTVEDFELVIVSDGSTDNTREIVARYDDNRIIFLEHDQSRGASAARNTGMRRATGLFIAFLDDDDEWLPSKLEMQLPMIEHSDAETGLIYAWMEYYRDGKRVQTWQPQLRGDVFLEMLNKQAIGGCPTVIIKRQVIDRVGFFDERLLRGNDGDFFRRIAKHYHVDFVPKILARIHVDSSDRISVNSRTNLLNAVTSYQMRLQKFADDYERHPDAHCETMLHIAALEIKLYRPLKGAHAIYMAWGYAPSHRMFWRAMVRSVFLDLWAGVVARIRRSLVTS